MVSNVTPLKLIILTFILASFAHARIPCDHETEVHLRIGVLCGVRGSINDSLVRKYLGVPFAEAPIGRNRFRKPVELSEWKDTFTATQYGPSCMQRRRSALQHMKVQNISEDCLHLNIFVPDTATENSSLAVMVWFHGGSYQSKQSQLFDGSLLAIDGNVIVVTANYRLGVFGFMTTGDKSTRGNYGLWDQIAALTWVRDNIASFGGDPRRLTVFGRSAGGYSASLLALTPHAQGLFHRVISGSGVAFCDRALAPAAETFSLDVATRLGCNGSSSAAMVECVRQVPATELLKAQEESIKTESKLDMIRTVGPVIDGELFTKPPREILKDPGALEYFQSLDYMAGVNNLDGSYFVLRGARGNVNYKEGVPLSYAKDLAVPAIVSAMFPKHQQLAEQAIMNFYFNESEIDINDNQTIATNLSNLYTDAAYLIPTFEQLFAHSQRNRGQSTLFYYFSFFDGSGNTPDWLRGAQHGSEARLIFGPDVWPIPMSISDEARNLSSIIRKAFTDFAKTGKAGKDWSQFSLDKQHYLELNVPSKVITDNKFCEPRTKFWFDVLPSMLETTSATSRARGHSAGSTSWITLLTGAAAMWAYVMP